MPNLDEIKARREEINGASWKAVEGNSNDIRSSVFAGNDLLATLSSWKRHEYADFIANTPADIDWLIGEVERLKAEKAQAEAERDALAAELKENWPFLGGVMYAAAEMVTNGMDATIPLDILMASGHWDEFEAHCNSCDVERFRQAVGEKCVNRLRRKPFSQQHAEKQGE